ncbi:MAG TPA: aminoglycoside phosphotransferase family protein [Acidimicrobiales bacterium]|nr:aminoglycoside phosphotransferase family protein [Acidimicrobiales bacterium]
MSPATKAAQVAAALGAFRFQGPVVAVDPLSGGHIHRNLLVRSAGARYVLQAINTAVFPDPETLLSNVERVTDHLQAHGRTTLALVETIGGRRSWRAADGSVWRAFHYLEGTEALASPRSPSDAFEAGRLFGDYRLALADLPGPPLTPTIERFHDLDHRRRALDAVVRADPVGRRVHVRRELDRTRRLGQQVAEAVAECCPTAARRTVHNDAKLANVRFEAGSSRALCVVDLDTTMAGLVHYDVGELVRSAATHAPEDATDTTTIDLDLELVGAVAEGYLSGAVDLDPPEIEGLALAGPLMTIENATRFLADHLAGDRYFAVAHPAHNLDRCRSQLRLTELMLESSVETVALFARAARPRPAGGPEASTTGGSR